MLKGVKEKVITLIKEQRELFQSELVKATGFSKSRISEVIAQLEREGMIVRTNIGRNSRITLRTVKSRDRNRIRLGFTRAAEYPFLIALRSILRKKSYELEFVVRENGIDVMTDLLFARIDVAVAPVLTQFIFHSIGTPMKIVGPAGAGGSSLLARKNPPSEARVISTKLSTMELLLRSCLNSCLFYSKETVYARSPEEIVDSMLKKRVDAACVWEPYATYLESHGFRRIARYSEIDDHICCILSARSDLPTEKLGMLKEGLVESIEFFLKEPWRYTEPYSLITGYPVKYVVSSLKEYSYPTYLNPSNIVKQFEMAGLSIPDPRTFNEAFELG